MHRPQARRSAGYITVEYAIVTAVVIAVLIGPIPGLGGDSLVDVIVDTLRDFQAHTATMLALP